MATSKNTYVKSPLNYTGGKHKLLPQILPLFPEFNERTTFVDLFTGGANVAANIKDVRRVIALDKNAEVIELYETFKKEGFDKCLEYIKSVIEKYDLTIQNAEGYNKFRDDYNKSSEMKANKLNLFILICYSFNHQIRFNSKGEFNMPFGKDRSCFNPNIEKNLKNFCETIKDIIFGYSDFRGLKIDKLSSDDFVYCDPPYLTTCASYNEQDGWNEQDERDLYDLLLKLNEQGIKFALSNVLYNKGVEHTMLKDFAEAHGFIIHHLDMSYSNCSYHAKDKTSKSDEVLITNY